MTTMLGGEIVVYEASDGAVQVAVRLEQDTVWLSLAQIADLFDRDKSVISRHLRNVFTSGELEREATVAKYATVQQEGDREVIREIEYFNLDAILSVGYRVNSKRGTQFRIWATRTLREHLLAGFTLNERRLAERGLGEMEQAVALLAQTLSAHALVTDEGQAVLQVIQRYARSWRWLIEYDEDRLAQTPAQPVTPGTLLGLDEAHIAIAALRSALLARGEASPLFGQERGRALAGILGAIEQTFDGTLLYPSAQEQAAHLLYFLVKDHPFVDGNKRIGALLFLEYLRRNDLLLDANARPRLADSAVVALTLLIAESQPRHKDLIIRLVLNLLEDEDR
ncbi:MAG TPA: RhuM family protein [Anaerolineae bacterium]|nr:RhuM family protein [Anaerolineae bacterium]HNU05399.1 RhuM family protein [Anaerolineae bacterium]